MQVRCKFSNFSPTRRLPGRWYGDERIRLIRGLTLSQLLTFQRAPFWFIALMAHTFFEDTMSKYWDIQKPLSYNSLFNFIIGNRGAGKTFGSLKYAIEKHLKRRENKERPFQFLYVRRHETELETLTKMRGGRLFNAHKSFFPTHNLRAESNILYCDDQVIGYAQALSTASKKKSDAFPNVEMIIFDEFIIDNSATYHYLRDEVRLMNDLYETVARPGTDHPRVVVFFLSNAVSITNPYFDFYHLDKPYHGDIQRFGKGKLILVQSVANEELIADKAKTDFYILNQDTEYFDYAVKNEWLLDNTDFIAHKPQRSKYYVTLRYMSTNIGIWFDPVDWLYYVSDNVNLECGQFYAVTTDDHKPNVLLFQAGKKLTIIKHLINAYQAGAVRYENLKLKNWFRDIMRMTN